MCILRWSSFFSLARCRDMPYCSGYDDTWSKRTGLCTVKRKRHCHLRNDRLKHAPESSFFLWEIFTNDKQSGVSYSLCACFCFYSTYLAHSCAYYLENDLIQILAKTQYIKNVFFLHARRKLITRFYIERASLSSFFKSILCLRRH